MRMMETLKNTTMNSKTDYTFLLRSGLILLSFLLVFCANEPQTMAENRHQLVQKTQTAPPNLHKPFDLLLQKYVIEKRFNYEGIAGNETDKQRLYDYVKTLEAQTPSNWRQQDALAFWINLYNAATLELVLKNYPVNSIKDIGGLLSSPWNQAVVSVEGQTLTLNQIENDIIRKKFSDARIHFAVNCAAISCPPIANHAYNGEKLDSLLDVATRRVLNDENWVEIKNDKLLLTKIFDWYEADFVKMAGSVREFIAKYRENDRQAILDEHRAIEYKDYNWILNKSEVR